MSSDPAEQRSVFDPTKVTKFHKEKDFSLLSSIILNFLN